MNRVFEAILVTLVLTGPLATALHAQEAPQPRTLTVTAQGQATGVPDVALVQIGVMERRDTATAALDAMNLAGSTVLDRLTAAGLSPADVQTGQVLLSPVFGTSGLSSAPDVAGFEAFMQLNVRVRQLASLGAVLDAVVEDGANRIDGLRFSMDRPEPLLDQARRDAVAQARARAELYAAAAGVRLGPLLTLTEQTGHGPEPMMMERFAMTDAVSVPISEGEVSLSATVTLVFAIE